MQNLRFHSGGFLAYNSVQSVEKADEVSEEQVASIFNL
jgi:hypothetical protein